MGEVHLYPGICIASERHSAWWGSLGSSDYRASSLIRNTPLLGPYSWIIPGFLWWS